MTPPADPSPIHTRGLFIACEGRDDEQFLLRILAVLRITGAVIRQYGGKPQLPTFLLGLRDSSEFESVRAVGIVRDADASAASAFQSVSDRLRRLKLPAARSAGELASGECGIDGMFRTIGVYIVPDNEAPGALEDLCLRAVSADDALTCVDTFLACVHQRTGITCPDVQRSKARLGAWLSSRTDPTLRIGQAIGSRDIPPDHDAFDGIKAFLRQLAHAAAAADA